MVLSPVSDKHNVNILNNSRMKYNLLYLDHVHTDHWAGGVEVDNFILTNNR